MNECRIVHQVRWRSTELSVENFILRECKLTPSATLTDHQMLQVQSWIECGAMVHEFLEDIRTSIRSFKTLSDLQNYPTWVIWHIAQKRGAREWEAWKRMMGSAD